jgi:hypothetical protein
MRPVLRVARGALLVLVAVVAALLVPVVLAGLAIGAFVDRICGIDSRTWRGITGDRTPHIL